MSASSTAKNAGVVAVVLTLLGVTADVFGLLSGLGFDPPVNLHDKLFPPAHAGARPAPSATTSMPGTKSTRSPAKTPATRARPAPATTHRTSVSHEPRPQGSSLGTALSGPGRPSGIFSSATGCSFGDCIDVDDPVDIGRGSYAGGWKFQCTIGCDDNWQMHLDVLLNGKYSRLNATLGIADSSSDSDHELSVAVIDVADNSVLYHADLAYGDSKTLKDFNVSGVVKLRVQFSGALAYTNGAVGSPVLYP